MFFWLIILIALALGAVHLAGGAPEGEAGFTITYLAIFGLGMVVAGVLRVLFAGGVAAFRQALGWAGALGVAALVISYRVELMDLYDRLSGEHVPNVAMTRTGSEAELRRAWDGHYRADARINGVSMRLLVDTGASMVLLPYEGIEKIGVDKDALSYSLPVTTANGPSSVAPIHLSSVIVGDIEVKDVTAAVARPGALTTGLLGMSFLDQLSETVFRRDRLILRQHDVGDSFRTSRFKRAPGTTDGMFSPDELRDQPEPH